MVSIFIVLFRARSFHFGICALVSFHYLWKIRVSFSYTIATSKYLILKNLQLGFFNKKSLVPLFYFLFSMHCFLPPHVLCILIIVMNEITGFENFTVQIIDKCVCQMYVSTNRCKFDWLRGKVFSFFNFFVMELLLYSPYFVISIKLPVTCQDWWNK